MTIINSKTESKTESESVSLHSQMKNMNTSQKIRFLNGMNYSRSEISKILFIRYQFVRNVLNQQVKNK